MFLVAGSVLVADSDQKIQRSRSLKRESCLSSKLPSCPVPLSPLSPLPLPIPLPLALPLALPLPLSSLSSLQSFFSPVSVRRLRTSLVCSFPRSLVSFRFHSPHERSGIGTCYVVWRQLFLFLAVIDLFEPTSLSLPLGVKKEEEQEQEQELGLV